MSTSLLVSTGAVSCYPASMVTLIWFADKKMFIMSALSNVGLQSGVSRTRNSTISQALCDGALSCSNMLKSNYPHKHVNAISLRVFCGCNCITLRICHQQTRSSSPSEQVVATDTPVETSKLVPVTHYDVSVKSRLAKNT